MEEEEIEYLDKDCCQVCGWWNCEGCEDNTDDCPDCGDVYCTGECQEPDDLPMYDDWRYEQGPDW